MGGPGSSISEHFRCRGVVCLLVGRYTSRMIFCGAVIGDEIIELQLQLDDVGERVEPMKKLNPELPWNSELGLR